MIKEVRQLVSEEADGMAHTGAIENLTRIKARESEDYVGHEKSAFEHGFDAYSWEQGYGSIDPGDPKKMDWYNTSGSWWDAYTKGDALAARVISATYTGQEQDLDDYGANIDNVTSAPGPYRQEDEEGPYTDSEGTEWDPATHAYWERKKAAGMPADPMFPSTRQPHAREVSGAFQSLGDAALRGSQVAMRRLKTAAKTDPDAQAILDGVAASLADKTVSPAAEDTDTMLEKKSKTMNITKKQLTQIILEELENVLSEDYYASAGFMREAPDIAARGLEMWLRVAPDGAADTDKNKERALKIAEEKIRELVNSQFGKRADADEIYKSIELLPRKIAMAMLGGGA